MKKIAVIVAVFGLVLAGLVFVLPMAINTTGLRAALADQLSHASGAKIALNGPIHFSVLPDFGVVVEDFEYSAFDGSITVSSERSLASVALVPLLSGRVQVTGIDLRSPRIVLTDDNATSQESPAQNQSGDVFKVIAGYLENVSIDHIVVTDGEVSRSTSGVATPVLSDIDMHLSIPGISAPASIAVSGLMDGNRMELTAEIGSLRDLLARQPAKIAISAKATQPPHPALADVTASGNMQLADDGSYRITGGEIDSAGQKMQLDASYVPGERSFVVARVKAGTLAYEDFQPAAAQTRSSELSSGGSATGPDLSMLKAFDADLELYADAVKVGDATARDVVIAAQLKDGRLVSTVDSTSVAGGGLVASIALDTNAAPLVSSGSLNLSSIDITQLLALAGQQAPLSGKLSSELQYAFMGLDADAIRNSLNLRGTASISGGRAEVPQLASFAGQGAGTVDALEAAVRIEDIRQPLTASGTARWKGEALGFSTTLTATDLLWGQRGNIAVDLKSAPMNASFSGAVAPTGQASGKASVSAPSLSRALSWLGQSSDAPLGQFAFAGGLSVNGGQVAVTDANIQLGDLSANGSVSVAMAGKPNVKASLSVDTLDFAVLTGGNGASVAAPSNAPAAIDLSMLRLFNADIQLAARQLGYGKVKLGPATASLSVADGVAKLSIPQATFYDGVISANVTANGAGSVPAIELAAAMEGVQAFPLMSDAAGFEQIEGRFKANIQVAGAGADGQSFAKSLNGPVSVVVSDGALRGIDVVGVVRNLRSVIGSGYAQDTSAKTEFSELSIAVNIANGVASTDNIRVLGPFVRMSGAGNVDLAAQTIDMRLDPRVVGSLDGQGGDFDVSGLGMPIIVKGPLSRPSIYPDISHILADPNRALQALAEMGGGIGTLANGASGLVEGLGPNLGGEAGALGNEALTNALGQLINGQGQPSGSATPSTTNEQAIVDALIGGVLGRGQSQSQPTAGAQEPTASLAPPAPQQTIALPRSDPRGPQVYTAPQPAPPTSLEQLITPPVTDAVPQTGTTEQDLIEGLINIFGN